MKYDDYRLEDFVNDAFFNRWVKSPNQESNAFWQTWIGQHPGKEEMIEEAKQLVLFLNFSPSLPAEEDFLEVKAAIKHQIRQEAALAATHPKNRQKVRPLFSWPSSLKIAAVVAGIMLLGSGLYFMVLEPAGGTSYATHYGETQTIWLPDSSTVVINANSSIRFAKEWQANKDREVWLTGEAFFDVRKKKSSAGSTRFIVHTEGLNVEVLGTTFNVKNRRGTVKIVLNTGKIKLNQSKDRKALMMNPGELVEFSEKNNGFVRKSVKPENYTSWRFNKLIFEETPVREIAQMLEDDYGVKVTISHPAIANRKFTGSVPKGNIHILLTVLAESLNINITRHTDEIIFNYK